MRLRGLRDIKTHGSLAREGRLISVARNLHRMESREREGGNISDDWSIERHIYKKKGPTKIFSPAVVPLHRELNLERRVRLHQIGVIRDFLQEMHQAIAEGIPVAVHEFERLTRRLTELEAE